MYDSVAGTRFLGSLFVLRVSCSVALAVAHLCRLDNGDICLRSYAKTRHRFLGQGVATHLIENDDVWPIGK